MNGLNPTLVTEEEMRAFFNRLIDTIVAGSQTHKDLADLRTRFDELNQRVNSLVEENESLRRERYTLVNDRDRYKGEADSNRQLAESYAKDADRWRDLYRNEANVREKLESQLAQANEKLKKAHEFFQSVFVAKPQTEPEPERVVPRFEEMKEAVKPVELVQELHPVQAITEGQDAPPKPTTEEIPWWKKDKEVS